MATTDSDGPGTDLAPCVKKLLKLWTGPWTLQKTQGAGWGSKSDCKATWESQSVDYCTYSAWRFTITIDVNAAYIMAKLATPEFMLEWDKGCSHLEVLDDDPEGNLCYSIKTPPVVASRDSVVYACGCALTPEEALWYRVAKNPTEAGPSTDDFYKASAQIKEPHRHIDRIEAPQVYSSGMKHCFIIGIEGRDDPRRPDPTPPHIRAKLYSAGFVGIPEGEGRTRLSYVQLADPGGVIPSFVINAAGGGELTNIWNLKKCCEEGFARQPIPEYPKPVFRDRANQQTTRDIDLESCASGIDTFADVSIVRSTRMQLAEPVGSGMSEKELRIALARAACGFILAVVSSRGLLTFAGEKLRSLILFLIDVVRSYHRPLTTTLALALSVSSLHQAWTLRNASRTGPPRALPPVAAIASPPTREMPPAGASQQEDPGLPLLVRKLLEFYQEGGWTKVERGEVDWDQKEVPHNKTPAVRMSVDVRCPMQVAVQFMLNSDNMSRYEELLDKQERLVDERPQRTVVHASFKTPSSMIAPRDIVTEAHPCLLRQQEAVAFGLISTADTSAGPFRRHGFDEVADSDIFVFGTGSVEHPSCPPKDGYTRAHSYATGYIFTPTAGGVRLTFVLDFDAKGWIPSSVTRQTLFLQKKKVLEMKRCLEEDAARVPPPAPKPAPAAADDSEAEPAPAAEPMPPLVGQILAFNKEPGWTEVARGKVDWDQKEVPHNKTPAVRMSTLVRCSMRTAIAFLRNAQNMPRYEELLEEREDLDGGAPGDSFRVMYASFSTPSSMVAQRDLVTRAESCLITPQEAAHYGLTGSAFAGRFAFDKADAASCYAIGTVSVEHPKRPVRSGYQRAQSNCAGYILEPAGEGSLRLTFILDFDAKGWIPASLTRNMLFLQKKKLGIIRRCLEEDEQRAA